MADRPRNSLLFCSLCGSKFEPLLPSHRQCPKCFDTARSTSQSQRDKHQPLGPANGGHKQNAQSQGASLSPIPEYPPCNFCTKPFSPRRPFHRLCPECVELRSQRQGAVNPLASSRPTPRPTTDQGLATPSVSVPC